MTANAGVFLCTEVAPRIRAAVSAAAKPIGAEDASELIQDTIAHAVALLHRAEAAGKQVAASTVAYFAVKLTRSGRRCTGSSATDVMHPGTQLAGRARLVSFDEPLGFDEAGESITLVDVFDNKQDDPSVLAARNLDWETFYGKQTRRGKRILAVVADGSTLRHGAQLLDLSDSGIQLEKKKLALALQEFLGANVLAEVKIPAQRAGLWAEASRGGQCRSNALRARSEI
jgi:hypothetical protein